MSPAGLSADHRRLVEQVHRAFTEPFTADQAADAWGVDSRRARRLVRYLADRGWLDRVRRGLYLPVPLDAHRSGIAYKDPWVVASVAYEPAYIAGWSAAEHWDLTEQIFRDILVVTGRRPRDRHPVIGETTLVLHTIGPENHFGLVPVWRGSHRVDATDPSRTVVDLLAHPSWGGGIRQVAEMITEYFDSPHRNAEMILNYGDRLGNRSVFKRLGLLLERLQIDAPDLIAESLQRRSAGITTLDPAVRARGQIVSRWGLRVNVEINPAT